MAVDNLPNPHFVAFEGVQTYFVNKDDAEALSAGYVEFYEDLARSVPKDVYKQVRLPDNTYDFINIGSVVSLTSVGTFSDPDNGNDIQVYAFPYAGTPEDPGEVQLYYLKVYSSDAIFQFDREAQPANFAGNLNPIDVFEPSVNQLSNSQFVEILFTPDPTTDAYEFSVSGTGTETQIAPDWTIVTNGTGTVTVKQVAISEAATPSNPPYVLDIQSTGIDDLILRQRLTADPRLFFDEIVSGYFIAASQDGSVTNLIMSYRPSDLTADSYIIIDDVTTADNEFKVFNDNVAIDQTGSTATAPSGYIDIDISIQVLKHIQISSIQLVSAQNLESKIEFIPESTSRQIDHLFHYYKPELEYKPIPSLLTGWDFPLNPTQFQVSGSLTGSGAYVWDQTIGARGAASTITFARSAVTGGLEFTVTSLAGDNDAFYILQYLTGAQAQEMLGTKLCSNIFAYKDGASDDVTVRVYMYRGSSSASIPSLGTTIGTLAANGEFTLTAANWTLIARDNLGTAIDTLQSVTTNHEINDVEDIKFSGWEITDSAQIGNTAYYAIVVTFEFLSNNTVITLNSISCNKGEIPTRPAPQTPNSALQDCAYYYQKSFPPGTLPAQNAGVTSASQGAQTSAAGTAASYGPIIRFPTFMRAVPTITLYNPSAANAQIRDGGAGTNWTASTSSAVSVWGFVATGTTPLVSNAGNSCLVHWAADARLGIV